MKACLRHVLMAVFIWLAGPAAAGELADAGALADSLVGQGGYLQALSAIDGAQEKVWQKTPLLFRNTVFVASEPGGFGIYDLHLGSTFKRGESLILYALYAEPVGY